MLRKFSKGKIKGQNSKCENYERKNNLLGKSRYTVKVAKHSGIKLVGRLKIIVVKSYISMINS